MIDSAAIQVRWETFGSKLDERGRRLFAAAEVRAAGRGGLALVSKITGLARSTINRGEDDLCSRLRRQDARQSRSLRRLRRDRQRRMGQPRDHVGHR
jgi:hypothetical protein